MQILCCFFHRVDESWCLQQQSDHRLVSKPIHRNVVAEVPWKAPAGIQYYTISMQCMSRCVEMQGAWSRRSHTHSGLSWSCSCKQGRLTQWACSHHHGFIHCLLAGVQVLRLCGAGSTSSSTTTTFTILTRASCCSGQA